MIQNIPIMHIPPTKEISGLHKPHNSWSDWDFSNGLMFLATDEFISPPSSLKRQSSSAPTTTVTLCRHASVQNLTEGQIETYLRRSSGTIPRVLFRSQFPLGTAAVYECYWVMFHPTETSARCQFLPTSLVLYPFFSYIMPDNSWVLIRISWWVGLSMECLSGVNVKLEVWQDGAWADKGTASHGFNLGADTGISRPGFSFYKGNIWADDTIIRGPA